MTPNINFGGGIFQLPLAVGRSKMYEHFDIFDRGQSLRRILQKPKSISFLHLQSNLNCYPWWNAIAAYHHLAKIVWLYTIQQFCRCVLESPRIIDLYTVVTYASSPHRFHLAIDIRQSLTADIFSRLVNPFNLLYCIINMLVIVFKFCYNIFC